MRRIAALFLSLGLIAPSLASPGPVAAAPGPETVGIPTPDIDAPLPRPRIIVPADARGEDAFPEFVARLEGAGLRVSHVIPQWDAVAGIWTGREVARACREAGGQALPRSRWGRRSAGEIPPGGNDTGSHRERVAGRDAARDTRLAAIARRWAEIRAQAATGDGGGPGDRDLFGVPHIRPRPEIPGPEPGAAESEFPPSGPLAHRPFGAGPLDVSEFLAGDIALGVIFPSSDGSIDPDTEDWTPAELDVQVAGILAGMEFWAATYPGRVRFFYRFEGEVPTGYEPIARPSGDDRLWFGDVLATLGFPAGNPWRAAYTYVDDLIRDLGTNWGGIYFSVDASNDADGLFADGFPDYTYFGGPMVITPSTHGGDGEEETPTYAAHEFAHLFYANDEYFWAFEPCDARSGYLGAPNQNSAFRNCRLAEECIMKTGYLPGAHSCIVTGAQLGMYDRDADGIPDVLDTAPAVSVDGDTLLVFREGDPMIVTGAATVRPATNRNPYGSGHAITTNTIAAVAGRVDGGPARMALPTDGAFDAGVEDFFLDLTGLPVGDLRLEVTPANSVGNDGPPAFVDVRVDPRRRSRSSPDSRLASPASPTRAPGGPLPPFVIPGAGLPRNEHPGAARRTGD